jgi:hypothetical protein
MTLQSRTASALVWRPYCDGALTSWTYHLHVNSTLQFLLQSVSLAAPFVALLVQFGPTQQIVLSFVYG